MRYVLIFGLMLGFYGCGDDTAANNANNGNNANNANNANNGNNANNMACPELARPDEMRIEVMRSDSDQLLELDATFEFDDGSDEMWRCSTATPDGILCDAQLIQINIVARLDDRGEITTVDLVDGDGFAFNGPVTFDWVDTPVSPGCSNTYRVGTFVATLAQ